MLLSTEKKINTSCMRSSIDIIYIEESHMSSYPLACFLQLPGKNELI